MLEFETKIRVRYAETDQMGYVYYGNYATYFEVARVEALRELGITYKDLESQGIILPVTHYSIDYKSPAKYDEVLRIKTKVADYGSIRMKFEYETYNIQGHLLNQAKVTIVFVDKTSRKIIKPHSKLMASLKELESRITDT